MVTRSGQTDTIVIYGYQIMKKIKWTWEEIHSMGRNSSDGGVRMMCEKLAVKIVKGIPLIENDIRYLNRINDYTVSKVT